AALVFAVLPLRLVSVAWITERRDVVCGLFSLLTVHAYLHACRRGEPDRPHRGWYWTAVLLFLLALLSKSIVVGLPLVLIALDVYPLKRPFARTAGWPGHLVRLTREKMPFLLLSIGVTLFMLVHWPTHGRLTPFARLAGGGGSWCWRQRGLFVSRRFAHLALGLSAAVAIGLSGLTTLQIRVWRDEEALWRQVLAADPEGPSAHYFLARVLAAKGRSA